MINQNDTQEFQEIESPENETNSQQPSTDELASCKLELAEWKERFLRVSADLENYRRRIEKEKVQWMAMSQGAILADLLPVLDNFDRALSDKDKANDPALARWIEGIILMRDSFNKVLHQYGVQEITESSTFDPELHEALMNVDAPGHESGSIVAVLEKGYRFKDQVLRAAKVSVAQ